MTTTAFPFMISCCTSTDLILPALGQHLSDIYFDMIVERAGLLMTRLFSHFKVYINDCRTNSKGWGFPRPFSMSEYVNSGKKMSKIVQYIATSIAKIISFTKLKAGATLYKLHILIMKRGDAKPILKVGDKVTFD